MKTRYSLISILTTLIFLVVAFPASADNASGGTSLTFADLDVPDDTSATIIVSEDEDMREDAEDAGYRYTTGSLEYAINISSPGDTIFLCPGEYEPIVLNDRDRDLLITGQDASVVSYDTYEIIIEIRGSENIKIENLDIYHAVTGYCLGGCVYICGAEDIEITNCDIHGSGAFGVDIDMSEEVVVTQNLIHNCTWSGILVDVWFECTGELNVSRDITIAGNYFYENAWDFDDAYYYDHAPDFYSDNFFYNPDSEYYGVLFDENEIDVWTDPEYVILVSPDPYVFEYADENGYKGGFTSIQPAVNSADRWDLILVLSGEYEPFSIYDKTDLTITGVNASIVSQNEWDILVHISSCQTISIGGFQLYHNVQGGPCSGECIWLDNSRECYINDCDIEGSGSYGVTVSNCLTVGVFDCEIHGCTYAGIQLIDFEYADYDTTNVMIQRCDFYDCPEYLEDNIEKGDWDGADFWNDNDFDAVG